ncbi:NAD(P)-dependent oxidoreductase [Litorihabitans aurantiacus]|uniref:Phosphoglycerate dehydrogenase n=1 Tax=Litorihabitans aurantiacus TaxID=1930061 RepID=A0AA37UJD4_9MICO|nr:NAD(P)-dependent oxidoreductase [Litorihabitans aurantiacus]GMA30235.1 phosphoglycerate dehydrogenase [Litorihabitans aurantiacus]
MKLLLPDSFPLSLDLPDGVETVTYAVRDPLPPEHHDAEGIVLWSLSPRWLARSAQELTSLRWAQTLTAGTDQIEAAGFADDVVLTSGNGLHDGPVAEHALALILAAARRLDVAVDARREHRWARELGVNQPRDNAERFTLVGGARVVIWGFGGIGQRLAGHLSALGAEVTGVAQRAGERAGFPVVTADALPEVLADADVLVNILPATSATAEVVDAATLALLPRKAWFVNVGRGATVDEAALRTALWDGVIAGAALDVMATEPLPTDDPLWDTPNVILTPHSAGGRPLGAEELVESNVAALLAGEELRNVVTL